VAQKSDEVADANVARQPLEFGPQASVASDGETNVVVGAPTGRDGRDQRIDAFVRLSELAHRDHAEDFRLEESLPWRGYEPIGRKLHVGNAKLAARTGIAPLKPFGRNIRSADRSAALFSEGAGKNASIHGA
jgi:hypothetical protein